MRRFARDNALSLFFLVLFVLALAGQSAAGTAAYNDRQLAEGGAPVSWAAYVTSSDFAVDVAENWQSEYLQFLLFILATVWWVQRGSPESKQPGKEGPESDADQQVGPHARPGSPAWARATGLRQTLYGNSLGLVMGLVFLLSWLAQSVAGLAGWNSERLSRLQDPLDWWGYVTSADFWNRTLQNWQSEFLAVLSMVVLSVYLRQRGSPESKPVGAPHGATDVEG
ncbi:DUF6766 family protein [Planomonospora parontospora]|uniref:DUF6766 family protein n=1 Tax=Planomonospora parontospora TaxID=58119 RepID=UPI001670689F|nr:DUF6766 family protein [Planomonospora parontospora]GGL51098.1 hypothetical protein GCM10014719_60490 [Planomonospora parontospora subsp. antibiotica]GII19015.1 hypothetical protein Ppa05_57410 [Planomonospora parontospora subsp. antibiotica]